MFRQQLRSGIDVILNPVIKGHRFSARAQNIRPHTLLGFLLPFRAVNIQRSYMSTKQIITVVGATGKQGGGCVDYLLQDGTFAVRGVTRNKDSDSAKSEYPSVHIPIVVSLIMSCRSTFQNWPIVEWK